MKKVITYGTFDLLHYGHINLLQRAKALGDYLIVAVSSDEFNRQKGEVCYFSYEERKRMVEALRCVDLVIPEESWDQKIRRLEGKIRFSQGLLRGGLSAENARDIHYKDKTGYIQELKYGSVGFAYFQIAEKHRFRVDRTA